MNIFSCKACKAHEYHIKSLEEQIAYFKAMTEPVQTYTDYPDVVDVPSIQPIMVPDRDLKERDFTVDELLMDTYE